MKKNLTLLTGIVFLITILLAGACSPAKGKEPKKVKIYVQAYEKDGKMHLKMYDSNDPSIVVIDTLHTKVWPGTKVIWKLVKDSGIKKLEKIGPKAPGRVINKDAKKIPGTKKFQFKIPDNAPDNTEDKYDIKFTDKNGDSYTIDPYLRIPRKQ
jgi:hypothetical protein